MAANCEIVGGAPMTLWVKGQIDGQTSMYALYCSIFGNPQKISCAYTSYSAKMSKNTRKGHTAQITMLDCSYGLKL